MNPESITTSLKWAKKLRDAGWEHETAISYAHDGRGWLQIYPGKEWYIKGNRHMCAGIFAGEPTEFTEVIPSPTAEEILRELPYGIQIFRSKAENGEFRVDFRGEDGYHSVSQMLSLVNAAAAMWIYLKENDLLPKNI